MQTVKMVVTGPFSAGKTAFIQSISEIDVVSTERKISREEERIKETTTVAMDFGRITISDDVVLYLFGTPGQDRFWFLWDELALGALGAVVIADTRRLAECFPSVDYFERRGTPFLVAVNCFNGEQRHTPERVRDALDLDPEVPVVLCDARDRQSGKGVFIALMEHVMSLALRRSDTARADN
jgi:signal recognition particle receptor subunit beta